MSRVSGLSLPLLTVSVMEFSMKTWYQRVTLHTEHSSERGKQEDASCYALNTFDVEGVKALFMERSNERSFDAI